MTSKYSKLLDELLKEIKDEALFLRKKDLNQIKDLICRIEERNKINERIQN